MRRCQEGDGAAFAELYTQYHDRLHRFCVRRLVDRDEADEVTQEAFLRAWRALPSFSGEQRFYPWLTVIAKNLCTDALRRRARYGTVEDFDRQPVNDATRADPSATTMSSEEAVMAAFDGQLAAEALTRLSDRHRNVLALREEAGLSYQEIARAEGVEISTVETLLWRARQALKREYAQLAGVRVLGGIFVGVGAIRRFFERTARRSSQVAMALSRVNAKGLAAAGVVTVALASIAATQSTSGVKTPATPPAATSAVPSAISTGASSAVTPPQSTGGATTPAGTPNATGSGSSGSSTPSAVSGTDSSGSPVGSAAAGVSQADSQLPPAPAAAVSTVVDQVGSNLSQTTETLNQVVGGAVGSLPLPVATPPVTLPPPVTKASSSLTSGLGGL